MDLSTSSLCLNYPALTSDFSVASNLNLISGYTMFSISVRNKLTNNQANAVCREEVSL